MQQLLTQQNVIQYTNNAAVKHSKFYSVAQRNALNAKNIVKYSVQQQQVAQQLAQYLQALYFSKHVHVSYNAKSIAVSVNSTANSAALAYYANKYKALVKQTQVSTILHLYTAV